MVLIQDILNGNLIAQETLYKRYRKIIKDFILGKYSTYYDIDDDVSEILIKIFINIQNFKENKAKFKSWVLSITKNYMIDKWRCTTACRTTILSASNNLILTSCGYTDSFFNNTYTINNANINNISVTNSSSCNFENANAVNYISTQLSSKDFTLLDMKYVQGYDYKEIGNEFQLTSSTISNKINYIKTKLKKNTSENLL